MTLSTTTGPDECYGGAFIPSPSPPLRRTKSTSRAAAPTRSRDAGGRVGGVGSATSGRRGTSGAPTSSNSQTLGVRRSKSVRSPRNNGNYERQTDHRATSSPKQQQQRHQTQQQHQQQRHQQQAEKKRSGSIKAKSGASSGASKKKEIPSPRKMEKKQQQQQQQQQQHRPRDIDKKIVTESKIKKRLILDDLAMSDVL